MIASRKPVRVLLTRPERDAQVWAADLCAHGIATHTLPLIDIGPCQHPQAQAMLRTARAGWSDYDAVMFVSGNAAEYFFCGNWQPAAPPDTHPRMWTPGPSTARVLHQLGVPLQYIDGPAHDAPQFDSEALWAQVAPQVVPGSQVLIVRGTTRGAYAGDGQGRDWLANQIRAAGGRVDYAVAYERGAPVWTSAQHLLARQAAHDGTLWLFSSSEAIGHLHTALAGQDWRGARALATHPRIATAARAIGFGWVQESPPALTQVLASIKSLL